LDAVVEPTVIVELWERLLVRERELDERENVLVAREHSMVEVDCALWRARTECDAIHDWVGSSNRTTELGCEPLSLVSGIP
jgi:hypothetical protein